MSVIHKASQSLNSHSIGTLCAALECYRNDNELRAAAAQHKADVAPSITERNDYTRAKLKFAENASEAATLRDMIEDTDGVALTVAVSAR